LLNRHAIVLLFGMTALFLLRGFPPSFTVWGAAFAAAVAGLFLDSGRQEDFRSQLGQLLQALAMVALAVEGILWSQLGWGSAHLWLSSFGVSLCLLGLLLEMRTDYRWLRFSVCIHAAGDALFLLAAAVGFLGREGVPSASGWVFIALAGGLGVYAASVNLALQLSRALNLKAGWRLRVFSWGREELVLSRGKSKISVPWAQVEAVTSLDGRHLVLVLPSPPPVALVEGGLPLDELRADEVSPPQKYGLTLHEQEVGMPVLRARALFDAFVHPENGASRVG
jgi:hypothetical protein